MAVHLPIRPIMYLRFMKCGPGILTTVAAVSGRIVPSAVASNIFFIKLNGHHHAIRHALGTHITVLDVAYVGHTVAYFKIYLIRTVKQRVINLFEAL